MNIIDNVLGRTELEAAEARLKSAQKTFDAAGVKSNEANAALTKATADYAARQAEVEDAERAYAETESGSDEKRFLKATDQLRLAEIRLRKPKAAAEQAAAALATASANLEIARRDVEIERLRKTASRDEWYEFATPRYDRIRALSAELRAEVDTVNRRWHQSQGASLRLAEMRANCPEAVQLSNVHFFGPALCSITADESRSALLALDGGGVFGIEPGLASNDLGFERFTRGPSFPHDFRPEIDRILGDRIVPRDAGRSVILRAAEAEQ